MFSANCSRVGRGKDEPATAGMGMTAWDRTAALPAKRSGLADPPMIRNEECTMNSTTLVSLLGCALAALLQIQPVLAQHPASPPAGKLPRVPARFEISVFASEPLFYKPTSLCFDAQGRLTLGQGPQYHLSESIKKSDSVVLLIDTDNDGVADRRQVFATGFNSIQGLAWQGRDLYVANSPELTVVRDLDGDDVADQYVVVYTDLGNHEHALHGLVWGPDGRLYMSKGNSKGHNQPQKYGRVAPRAFRELWDVEHPVGAADIPPPRTFTARNYLKTYHDPHDDWGREGGVLRCEPLGAKLEIVSRGMRNPWDIAIDNGFNLLGTDNDQTQGDRIIMPFYGAHFGWGHRYSSHWTGAGNLPTVPVSGPMTSGSWSGITWYDHKQFPAGYRKVFFINDWLFGTYVYRPGWKGALRTSVDGTLEPFIQRREGGMIYRPTDIAFGPDGAIYTLGWGGNYHYETGQEGSWVFRVTHRDAAARPDSTIHTPPEKRSLEQLLDALAPGTLPARRVIAQNELVRRGTAIAAELVKAISGARLNMGQQTWAVWAMGRMADLEDSHIETIHGWAIPAKRSRVSRNLRIQSLRILAYWARRSGKHESLLPTVNAALRDPDPRIRFEAMQAVHQARLKTAIQRVIDQVAKETDRVVFYAGWQALRELASLKTRRSWLDHSSARVRLATLLGLQEDFAVTQKDVLALVDRESDPVVQSWGLTFAMNPLPPAKLSNSTLRIEMEQTVPIADIIDRANKAKRPALRRLYLQMLSRASVREGKQQRQLLALYRGLQSLDERALVLPAAATTLEAFPDLWKALGTEPLRDSAVAGIGNLHRLGVKQLKSNESDVRSTTRNLSSVDGFAAEIADRLFANMANVGSDDARVAAALRSLNALPLPRDWSIGNQALETLLDILNKRKEPAIRRRALRLLCKLKPSTLAASPQLSRILRGLCQTPDAHLYRDLQAVKAHLGLDISVPKPKAATQADVLARLDQANTSRGKEIFFDRIGGAGCVICHRVRGRGSDLGPDLSGVGVRLTPQNMVQAIIQPNAAITEGYALQLVLTEDGKTHSGAVILETDSAIRLLSSDGTLITIQTATIESRKRLKQSVMPTGYALFGADQVADLTAWLLTLRDAGSQITSGVKE